MAGIITHLAIADKMSVILGDKIKSVPYFFSGNIAPDSIHSRENFTREMKKHTHLRDDIRDAVFLEPENQEVFYARIDDFITNYCIKGSGDYDLYCGYLAHVITDELHHKTIRQGFRVAMEKEGINQSDKPFFTKVSFDLNNIDNRLSQEYPFVNNPKNTLWGVMDYEIHNYLTADELNGSKGWATWNWFDETRSWEEPVYISYERTLEFIDYAAGEIIKRFENYSLY